MASPRTSPAYAATAARHPYNLLALGALLGVAFIAGSWLLTFLVLGLEALYLLLVPDLAAWRRYVDRLEAKAREAEGAAKFEALRDELGWGPAKEIADMEAALDRVETNIASKGDAVRAVLGDTLVAVRRMVLTYPRLAQECQQLTRLKDQNTLKSMRESVEKLIDRCATAREAGQGALLALLEQRLAVARRRLIAYERIDEELLLRTTQMETIRETVAMLNEESVAPRDPARFQAEVSTFLTELDAATAHAGELASMEEELAVDAAVRTRFSA